MQIQGCSQEINGKQWLDKFVLTFMKLELVRRNAFGVI